MFDCMKMDASYNGSWKTISTYFEKNAVALCVKRDASNVDVKFSGYNGYDLVEG
jgi:hypothetical protein